jgi:hypothetical protein
VVVVVVVVGGAVVVVVAAGVVVVVVAGAVVLVVAGGGVVDGAGGTGLSDSGSAVEYVQLTVSRASVSGQERVRRGPVRLTVLMGVPGSGRKSFQQLRAGSDGERGLRGRRVRPWRRCDR